MGEPSRLLSLWLEQLSRLLTRLSTDIPPAWLWVALGLCVLLLFGLLLSNRALRRKLRYLETVSGVPEQQVVQRQGTVPIDSETGGEPYGHPGEWPRTREGKEPEGVCEETDRSGVSVEVDVPGGERFFSRLKERLVRTQGEFVGRLDQVLFSKGTLTEGVLEELEEVLVTADLGVKTSRELLGDLRKEIGREKVSPEHVRETLKEKIGTLLSVGADRGMDIGWGGPFVIMLVGVNGVGKTTTAGKLAAHLGRGRHKVMLVAADTFRPAAIEQLQTWSDRVGADLIRHQTGADPSAVVFDAMRAAKSRKTDLVLVDTAGRLHTKKNLMEELKKIKKVMGRELSGAPQEIFLVLDATTGQNAIQQARIFHESLGVTGLVLTKLDGTAKGGVIVGVTNELQVPVRFIGIGEQTQDLQEFRSHVFLEVLFGGSVGRLHGTG